MHIEGNNLSSDSGILGYAFALTQRNMLNWGVISGMRVGSVGDICIFGVGGPSLRQALVYHIQGSRGEGVHMHHVLSGVWQSGDISADGAQITTLNSRPHRLLKLRAYLGRLAGGSALATEQTGSLLISASDMALWYWVSMWTITRIFEIWSFGSNLTLSLIFESKC